MKALAIAALVATGCASFGSGLYNETRDNTFSLRQYTTFLVKGGRPGAIHPAVIEFVFASEDAPWVPYYDTYLYREKLNGDMRELGEQARDIAGANAALSGQHYARARARRLTKYINRGLAMKSEEHAGIEIICCKTTNRDTRRLEKGRVRAFLLGNQRSQVVMLKWNDGRTTRVLTWDLTHVPHAFDPTAALDYATVVATIRPMHQPQPRF